MNIKIQRATFELIDQVVGLLEKLHKSAGFSQIAEFDKASAEAFTVRLIESPKAELLVAVSEDTVIGLSSFVVDTPYYNWDAKVASGISFWVEPEYRKSGIGKALYEVCERKAKELGCSGITVGVMDQDEYLKGYHQRNGFEPQEVLLFKGL